MKNRDKTCNEEETMYLYIYICYIIYSTLNVPKASKMAFASASALNIEFALGKKSHSDLPGCPHCDEAQVLA